jgi:hypothetical protein
MLKVVVQQPVFAVTVGHMTGTAPVLLPIPIHFNHEPNRNSIHDTLVRSDATAFLRKFAQETI